MATSSDPLVVVHASVTATRHRGAVLDEVAGRPAVDLLLARLGAPSTLRTGTTAVVTSDLAADDTVAEHAARAGWRTIRGPVDDLLAGLSIALVRFPADELALVEATGPLGDPHLVAATVELHRRSRADHTSNLAPRSHPRGLDVEVFGARTLRRCELELSDPDDRRHLGAHLRRHPERFRLANLTSGHALAGEDWSIDTAADLDRLRGVAGQLRDPVGTTWDRILGVAGRTNRARPGDVVLTPRTTVAAGSSPWVQRWDATLDGRDLGTVATSVEAGRTETEVQVAAEHVEAVRAAFYRLVGLELLRGA